MMNTCYFEESPPWSALARDRTLKVCLQTVAAGLRVLSQYRVVVVYPPPWSLSAAQQEAWLDYYLRALSVHERYPARVTFQALEVWLTENGGGQTGLQDAGSLDALLTFHETPALLELLAVLDTLSHPATISMDSGRVLAHVSESKVLTRRHVESIRGLQQQVAELAEEQAKQPMLESQLATAIAERDAARFMAAALESRVQMLDAQSECVNGQTTHDQNRLQQERDTALQDVQLLQTQLLALEQRLQVLQDENHQLLAEASAASATMLRASRCLLDGPSGRQQGVQ